MAFWIAILGFLCKYIATPLAFFLLLDYVGPPFAVAYAVLTALILVGATVLLKKGEKIFKEKVFDNPWQDVFLRLPFWPMDLVGFLFRRLEHRLYGY